MSENPSQTSQPEENLTLFEHLPVGIFRTSADGKIAYANQTLANILGDKSPEALIKRVKHVKDELYADPNKSAQMLIDELEAQSVVMMRETAIKHNNGDIIYCILNIRAVKENGKMLFLEGTVQDITEQKLASLLISRRNAELEEWVKQRTIELEKANHELSHEVEERKRVEKELQQLAQAEQKRRIELEKLTRVSLALRQARQSTDFLEMLTREVRDLCSADLVSGVLFKETQSPVTTTVTRTDFTVSQGQSEAIQGILYGAQSSEQVAVVPGFETCILLKLQSFERMHGALLAASREANAFNQDELNMLAAIADMAGIALQRIDMLETVEMRAENRRHDLVVLYNLMTIIAESMSLQDILELSLILTLETIHINKGILYTVEESAGKQTLKAVSMRWGAPGITPERSHAVNDAFAQQVLDTGNELIIEELASQPAYADIDACCYAGIPIRSRGKIRGVFSLFADEKHKFTTDTMALLSSISDHVGIGIENATLFDKTQKN
jgi:PAS domain S-box-containing protein